MVKKRKKRVKSSTLSKNNVYKNIFILQKEWGRKLIKKYVKQSVVGNKIPLFPISKIEIHPSGTCNFNCKFCYGNLLAPKERANLSAKNVKIMLDDIKENLPNENPLIILSGLYSEPLANPEIKEIIQTIGDHNFRLGLYTNGVLFDNGLIESVLQVAKSAKSDLPSYVSFNVTGAITNNCFEKQIKVISAFSKAKKKAKLDSDLFLINAPVLVEDLSKNGLKSLEIIIKTLKKAGAENIRLSMPWEQLSLDSTKGLSNHKLIGIGALKKIAKKFNQVYVRETVEQGNHNGCYALARSVVISPEGLIFACPETCTPLLKDKFSYGSILNDKISTLWHGARHEELFKKLVPKNEHCKCCPINNKFNLFCSSCVE